jgi:serine protease Do
MKKIKFIFLTLIFTFSFSIQSNSKSVPASFADLAERLMPSVVNISTTQTVVTNTNPCHLLFLQDHHLKICLENLELHKKENHLHLGSGFIIDEKGIVVTNNHVIQGCRRYHS